VDLHILANPARPLRTFNAQHNPYLLPGGKLIP